MSTHTVYILNGPNLNLLGLREPRIYGTRTLEDILSDLRKKAEGLGLRLDCRQTNGEGELVTFAQEAGAKGDGILINPGAYGHTSVALMDALKAAACPVVEVHLSNIFKREEFRHFSYVSLVADGVICGLADQSYLLGLDALYHLIQQRKQPT